MYGIWKTLAERPKPTTPTWYVFDMVMNEGYFFFLLFFLDKPEVGDKAGQMFRAAFDFESKEENDFNGGVSDIGEARVMFCLPPSRIRNTPQKG